MQYLSTGSISATSICICQRNEFSRPGSLRRTIFRHRALPRSVDLIHRRARAPERPAPPRPAVVYNTIQQSIVHQTTVQHIHNRLSAGGLRKKRLLTVLRQTAAQGEREGGLDPSRPTRAARALLRIFSRESARRELQPFFSGLMRGALREERERYKARPARAVSLLWTLLGRQTVLRTLTGVCLDAGVLIRRRYVRRVREDTYRPLPPHCTVREMAAPEGLFRYPEPRSLLLPERERAEKAHLAGGEENRPAESESSRQPVRLSPADFQALVRGVADTLGRQARLESLRRGGGVNG